MRVKDSGYWVWGFHGLLAGFGFVRRFPDSVEVADLPRITMGDVEEPSDTDAGDSRPIELPHPLDVPRAGTSPVLPPGPIPDWGWVWGDVRRAGH